MEKHYCIVLRTVNYKDYDKMLTLFSREQGRLDVMAKGARKSRSQLAASSQPFCCGEFEMDKWKDRLYLKATQIKQEFYEIQKDFERYAAACVMMELTEKTLKNTTEYDRLFLMLVYSLYAMEQKTIQPKLALVYFFIQVTELLGVFPSMDGCVVCGRGECEWLDIRKGGLVCANCTGGSDCIKMEEPLITAMEVLRRISPKHIEAASSLEVDFAPLVEMMGRYIAKQLGVKLRTMSIYMQNTE